MKVKRNSVIKFSFAMMFTLTVLTGLMFVDYDAAHKQLGEYIYDTRR